MSMTIAYLDDWEYVADLYDPEPYRKAFMLENLVFGKCCIESIAYCYFDRIETHGDCCFLFDQWPTASYCGPAFVRKYKIPRKER